VVALRVVTKDELVVVSQLSDMDCVFGNFIDEPVLVGDPPGPVAAREIGDIIPIFFTHHPSTHVELSTPPYFLSISRID